jgi:threonylcarbamoyladenosine tRNA methylthiotransferase MtaB
MFSSILNDNTEAAEMLGVVPENVRVKRSKMMRGLSVKNAALL